MNAKNNQILLIAGLVLILVVLAAVFVSALHFTQAFPGGDDFMRHWAAARAFLLGNGNLYAPSLSDTSLQPRVDEPFYLQLFYFPFALLSNGAVARATWMLAALMGLVSMAFLSLRLTRWRPRWGFLLAFVVFALLWPHHLSALLSGNNIIWQYAALAAGLVMLQAENDEAAGFFFLLGAFRWQAVLPFFIFLGWWLVSQRRWHVWAGFGMGLVLGVGLSFLLQPGWFLPWLRAAYFNLRHNDWLTVRTVLLAWWPGIGLRLAQGVQIAALLGMLAEWVLARRQSLRHFTWTAALTLALTPLTGLPVDFSTYVFYFLPLTLTLAVFAGRWRAGRWIVLTLLLVLLAGAWALFWAVHMGWLTARALFFPLPLLSLIGLYWVRWWAVQMPVTFMDSVAELG